MSVRVVRVESKKDIRTFVNFPDRLYRGDVNYTPHIKSDLSRTLSKLLFKDRTYRALLALDEKGTPQARVLFTVDKNKQLDTDRCGFFSFYECVDDDAVSSAILSRMIDELRDMGAEYASGAFFPFDPDNRRGIMVKGFETPPMIFTSYNPPYYDAQLSAFGLEKQIDLYQYAVPYGDETLTRLGRLSDRVKTHAGVHIDSLNVKKIDRDVHDFCLVMQTATTEINYQAAPSEDEIRSILKGWRRFLNPDLILIARRDEDNAPIGIAMSIPDYFEVFRKMRGKTGLRELLLLARSKKTIRGVRAMLQYVIPEYQKQGVIASLAYEMFSAARRCGFERLEAGTILENNPASLGVMATIRGELARIYRIYTMKL